MEQLNYSLPAKEEGSKPVEVTQYPMSPDSPLLNKVRQNFSFFGTISLIFGVAFAFLFYQVGIGLNVLAFVIVMITLLQLIMKKLRLPTKKVTYAYYLGAVLLGLSSTLTYNGVLQLMNFVGILLLLDVSLLHQFHKDKAWDFGEYALRVFGLLFRCISKLGTPFVDCFRFLNNIKIFKSKRMKNLIFGVLLSLPLLWVIIFLLAQADYIFQKLTRSSLQFLFSQNIVGVTLMIIFGFISCYCIICGSADKTIPIEGEKKNRKADPGIAFTTMTLILVVYIVFCSIQIIYLFANGVFILPQDFTFAEYARRGFFELLAVTCINILLMIICSSLFEESKSLRIVLTGITICSYIMIASAAYRMLLYISAYNLTFLRLFVLLFLLIDALVLAGMILAQYKRSFPLFLYCVAVVSICYIAFSFARPDYLIASYHIKNENQLSKADLYYLTNEISLDAAPILVPYLTDSKNEELLSELSKEQTDTYYDLSSTEITEEYFQRIARISGRKSIREYNYSYYKALQIYDQFHE